MIQQGLRTVVLGVLIAILPTLSQAQTTLTILHANDTHSNLFPFPTGEQYGGIARMATMIGQLRAQNANVLALHAGDVFVGTFEYNKYLGYPELQIMQGLYDAMGFGNHEFDLGVDALAGVLSGTLAEGDPITLPITCANIKLAQASSIKPFVKPYLIRQIGDVKIGIFGVVTNEPIYYSPTVHPIFKDPYSSAAKMAALLKSTKGCQVVICVSHLGLAADRLGLSRVPGIDIIVGGHSHTALSEVVRAGGKIIVQAGEFGKYLGELTVNVTDAGVKLKSYTLHPIHSTVPEAPSLLPTLKVLKDGIKQDPRFGPVYTKQVATAAWDLEEQWITGDSNRDTPLGNLVTDAMKTKVRDEGFFADCAVEANGYIGHRIYEGTVVGNDVMRSVPYGYDPTTGLDFKVYTVLLYGAQLLAGLEYTVSAAEYTDSLSLQASGLTYKYDTSKSPAPLGQFSRLDLSSVKINGQSVSSSGAYWVVMNEQLLRFLQTLGLVPLRAIDTGLFEYEAVRDYMRSLKELRYVVEGRVVDTAQESVPAQWGYSREPFLGIAPR